MARSSAANCFWSLRDNCMISSGDRRFSRILAILMIPFEQIIGQFAEEGGGKAQA